MDNEQRGDIAQAEFTRWCALASPRMVPVLAQPDRFGWDYLVTLRLKEPRTAPRESGPTEPQCKVQVKAAMPGVWSVSITLSNWERMVKEPMPWFVAVFRFSKDNAEPLEAFLVSIGRDHVAAVLARLRRNDLAEENEREALNKVEMSAAFSEDDRVRNPSELRAKVEAHLGPSAAEYARKKQEWNATVGYGEHPFRLLLSTERAERRANERLWAAWSLGHRVALRVEDVRAERIRFGLAGPHEEFPAIAAGTLVLSRAPSGETVVTVSDPEGSKVASVRCATFSTGPVAHFIASDLHMVRLAAPYLEFLFSDVEGTNPMKVDGEVHLPGGDAYVSLEDARRAARVALVMAEGRATGFVFRVETEGKTMTAHVPPGVLTPSDEVARKARLFDIAATIAHHAGLDVGRLQISPTEMGRSEGPILTLGASFDTSLARLLRVGRDKAVSWPGARAIWPFPCVVHYDTHVVGAIVTVEGTLAPLPTQDAPVEYEIATPTFKRHHAFVVRRDEWDPTAFRVRLKALVLESINSDTPA